MNLRNYTTEKFKISQATNTSFNRLFSSIKNQITADIAVRLHRRGLGWTDIADIVKVHQKNLSRHITRYSTEK